MLAGLALCLSGSLLAAGGRQNDLQSCVCMSTDRTSYSSLCCSDQLVYLVAQLLVKWTQFLQYLYITLHHYDIITESY